MILHHRLADYRAGITSPVWHAHARAHADAHRRTIQTKHTRRPTRPDLSNWQVAPMEQKSVLLLLLRENTQSRRLPEPDLTFEPGTSIALYLVFKESLNGKWTSFIVYSAF